MLKKILLAFALALIILGIVIQVQPATYHVERSTAVAAPSERVFAMVNDFHNWSEWSPWEKLDPSMKKTYSGPPAGTGAGYAWQGNSQVGEGRMQITDSVPTRKVTVHLEFLKPFPSESITTFTTQSDASGSRVTWAMDGQSNFLTKAMNLFTSMDKMIGPDFERGLAQLKAKAEASKS